MSEIREKFQVILGDNYQAALERYQNSVAATKRDALFGLTLPQAAYNFVRAVEAGEFIKPDDKDQKIEIAHVVYGLLILQEEQPEQLLLVQQIEQIMDLLCNDPGLVSADTQDTTHPMGIMESLRQLCTSFNFKKLQ